MKFTLPTLVCLAVIAAPLGFAQSASPSPKAAYGEFGIDLTTIDPTTRAGDDFFKHVNGKWLETFQIPADKSSYGTLTALHDIAEQRTREIIEAAAASQAAAGTPARRVGDFYTAFMDTAGIEARGIAALQPDLARIAAAQSPADLARLFALPGYISPIDLGVGIDRKDSTKYVFAISQGGLGLPDRDYYLSDDPKFKEARERYGAFIQQMLELEGDQEAAAKAPKVLAFEVAVAQVSWSRERRRNVEERYNPRSKTELLAYAPGFEWQVFFDTSEIGTRDHFVVGELTAVRDIAALVGKTDLFTLKAYLTFHLLASNAAILPKAFDDANFAFFGNYLSGQPVQRERWKRGVQAIDGALGEQIGQVYVQKYFTPEAKAQMVALVKNLQIALDHRIDLLDWMTPATKAKAHLKLAAFTVKVGYPDKWKDYSTLEIRRDDPIGNTRRVALWNWHRDLARFDQPVDKSEWSMTPQTVNAYYNSSNNEIVFPAAILQPPFFDPHADAAVNYGGIGAVIGHEMTHGFDDQGRKSGPHGDLTDWWSPEDAAAFKARAAKLIAEFNGFEALPGLHVRGATTLGENIADLGGVNIALDAYHNSLQGRPAPVLDGLTGDQRFFLSWAQVWSTKYRDGILRQLTVSDPHSPGMFRVNGPLPNIDAWYAAFDVKPGDKLYRAPEDRIKIW